MTPQHTYAILTKYASLKIFHEVMDSFSPLGMYIYHSLEHKLYKLITSIARLRKRWYLYGCAFRCLHGLQVNLETYSDHEPGIQTWNHWFGKIWALQGASRVHRRVRACIEACYSRHSLNIYQWWVSRELWKSTGPATEEGYFQAEHIALWTV